MSSPSVADNQELTPVVDDEWRDAVLAGFAEEFPRELHFAKGHFTYVPGYAYIERANKIVREWDSECLGLDQVTVLGKDMLIARVCVTIPGLGRRCHVGVQLPQQNIGEDATIKGAVTDGIKKALSLFGMGLYMSHKEEVDALPREANYGVDGSSPSTPAPASYGPREDQAATARTKDNFQKLIKAVGVSDAGADTLATKTYNKEHWSYLSERQLTSLIRMIQDGLRPAAKDQ